MPIMNIWKGRKLGSLLVCQELVSGGASHLRIRNVNLVVDLFFYSLTLNLILSFTDCSWVTLRLNYSMFILFAMFCIVFWEVFDRRSAVSGSSWIILYICNIDIAWLRMHRWAGNWVSSLWRILKCPCLFLSLNDLISSSFLSPKTACIYVYVSIAYHYLILFK